MSLATTRVPWALPWMSLIPAKMPLKPWVPYGLEISECSMVTPLGLLTRLTPSPPMSSPKLLIETFLTVTLEAITLTEPFTENPENTVPAAVILTLPSEYDQPGPEETWPGTARSATPLGTPVLVLSG